MLDSYLRTVFPDAHAPTAAGERALAGWSTAAPARVEPTRRVRTLATAAAEAGARIDIEVVEHVSRSDPSADPDPTIVVATATSPHDEHLSLTLKLPHRQTNQVIARLKHDQHHLRRVVERLPVAIAMELATSPSLERIGGALSEMPVRRILGPHATHATAELADDEIRDRTAQIFKALEQTAKETDRQVSDIHVEHDTDATRFLVRIDGTLTEAPCPHHGSLDGALLDAYLREHARPRGHADRDVTFEYLLAAIDSDIPLATPVMLRVDLAPVAGLVRAHLIRYAGP